MVQKEKRIIITQSASAWFIYYAILNTVLYSNDIEKGRMNGNNVCRLMAYSYTPRAFSNGILPGEQLSGVDAVANGKARTVN